MHQIEAHDSVNIGSERSFGIVFAAVFTFVSAWPLVRGQNPGLLAFAAACAFLIIALWRPGLLKPLNRAWFKFGLLLSRITTPLVMGVLYFVVVVPTGLVMRLRGKDLLALRFDSEAPTYWITRDPPGPEPDTMRNQF